MRKFKKEFTSSENCQILENIIMKVMELFTLDALHFGCKQARFSFVYID